MSPNFAKNVRSLITRVNKKKPKKKKTSNYKPFTIKEEEEEEILATKAIVESNTTEVTVESTTNETPNLTDLLVFRGLSHDRKNPRIELIYPKTPLKSFTA
jgi:hypothetical protein